MRELEEELGNLAAFWIRFGSTMQIGNISYLVVIFLYLISNRTKLYYLFTLCIELHSIQGSHRRSSTKYQPQSFVHSRSSKLPRLTHPTSRQLETCQNFVQERLPVMQSINCH